MPSQPCWCTQQKRETSAGNLTLLLSRDWNPAWIMAFPKNNVKFQPMKFQYVISWNGIDDKFHQSFSCAFFSFTLNLRNEPRPFYFCLWCVCSLIDEKIAPQLVLFFQCNINSPCAWQWRHKRNWSQNQRDEGPWNSFSSSHLCQFQSLIYTYTPSSVFSAFISGILFPSLFASSFTVAFLMAGTLSEWSIFISAFFAVTSGFLLFGSGFLGGRLGFCGFFAGIGRGASVLRSVSALVDGGGKGFFDAGCSVAVGAGGFISGRPGEVNCSGVPSAPCKERHKKPLKNLPFSRETSLD